MSFVFILTNSNIILNIYAFILKIGGFSTFFPIGIAGLVLDFSLLNYSDGILNFVLSLQKYIFPTRCGSHVGKTHESTTMAFLS